jgi:hypothetical protein
MKKLFLLPLALCLLFLGCEKEGVFNPSKKIKRISYQEQNGPKYMESEWTWEKNLLKKIQYYNGFAPSFDERYSYENKQVVKVDRSDGAYWKISYNSNLYDKAELFDSKGTIMLSARFIYDKKKVSRMDLTIYQYDGGWKLEMLSTGFMSNLFSKELIHSLERISSKSKSKAVTTTTYKIFYTYEKDNIKEQVLEYSYVGEIYGFEYSVSGRSTIKFEKYDNSSNPMYRFYSMGEGVGFVSPKNNPLEIISEYNETFTFLDETESEYERYTITYDYSYDGKFPTEVVETERDSEGYVFRTTTFLDYQ